MSVRTYRFVPLRRVEGFLAASWIPCGGLAECHHGRWSVLMRACACWGGA